MQIDDDFGVEPETTTRKRWKDMTDEERRAADAERQRNKRKRVSAAKAAQAAGTREDYWQSQRAQLSPEGRVSFEREQEMVFNHLYVMKTAVNLPESDAQHIPVDDAVADLVEFIREHPCVRLTWTRGELSLTWSSEKFWTDSATMEAVEAQGHSTEVFARYGFWVALEDTAVYRFLNERAKWSHDRISQLLGIKENR